MIRVRANGIEFEVFTAGSGNRLALCLHGFPECAFSWRFQMPLLAEIGYRVWAPNLRGYGGTDSPADVEAYRLETLVADVAGLIEAAGARETVLIGHDWGAMVAWCFAAGRIRPLERLGIMNVPPPLWFSAALGDWRPRRRSWDMGRGRLC